MNDQPFLHDILGDPFRRLAAGGGDGYNPFQILRNHDGFWRRNVEVRIQRRLLGAERPHTLLTMSNLGVTYYSPSKYPQAAVLQIQNVEARRRVLGPEHPETVASMNNRLSPITYRESTKLPRHSS